MKLKRIFEGFAALAFSLIVLPCTTVAQENSESSNQRLRFQAEAAFKEPPPSYSDFDYVSISKIHHVLRLPEIARMGHLSAYDLNVANEFTLFHRCDYHSLSNDDTDKNWEHNPTIEADMPEVDFAPIAPGFAILTFRGKFKVLNGALKAKLTDSRRAIVPIVLQAKYPTDTKILTSFNGSINWGLSGYDAAVRLDQEATHAAVFFVDASHALIPTRWIHPDGLKEPLPLIKIDREALAAAQPEKAKRERLAKEVEVKEESSRAAAESAKRREEERARVETQARQKQLAEMDLRDWKNKSGKSWRAEFVEFKDGVVTLTTDQFEPIKVRFSELNSASLKQLRAILKARRSNEKPADE